MAFAGVIVSQVFVGVNGADGTAPAIVSKPTQSESIAAPGTTTMVATKGTRDAVLRDGQPCFVYVAAADAYVAIGPTPDASASPRRLAKAGVEYTVGVAVGDKLAYIAVP